jgi:hypothetical protein
MLIMNISLKIIIIYLFLFYHGERWVKGNVVTEPKRFFMHELVLLSF